MPSAVCYATGWAVECLDVAGAAITTAVATAAGATQIITAGGVGGGGEKSGGGNGGGGNADNNGGRRGGGGLGGEPSPEVEALQKAIDSKASNTEMKAALAKVQEARKTHQTELEKAQADLKKVLSVKQEAVATMNGLL